MKTMFLSSLLALISTSLYAGEPCGRWVSCSDMSSMTNTSRLVYGTDAEIEPWRQEKMAKTYKAPTPPMAEEADNAVSPLAFDLSAADTSVEDVLAEERRLALEADEAALAEDAAASAAMMDTAAKAAAGAILNSQIPQPFVFGSEPNSTQTPLNRVRITN